MTQDEAQFMKLGKEIVRMIHDVRKVAKDETGYARRTFTYPGGECCIFVVNDKRLADIFDKAAEATHRVANAVPPSTLT